ncbi:MAG: anthranilate phosphoribosyltransferase [Candidatus Aureabacteria bacterium]|nr:anthranilate phosphoribosyltransferase [Candidatus Auribacterota bacterium]
MDLKEFIREALPRLFPPPEQFSKRELLQLGMRLADGERISPEETACAMEIMIGGGASAYETALFLTALQPETCTPEILAAMARIMRSKAVPVTLRSAKRILGDNCGTGGDNLHLFNVSTATMFILAASGIAIAKHGNRASTSQCGSADVLESLGVKIDLGPEAVAHCIDGIGLGFMFAPRYHPAMKHVSGVRRRLPFRTVFNILGPLCNPAPVTFQLLGVYHPDTLDLAAHTLMLLNVPRSLIVCGETDTKGEWMDEVSTSGPTHAVRIENGVLHHITLEPSDFGIPPCSVRELRGGTPSQNASILRDILSGAGKGPRRDICLANAAAGLYACGAVEQISLGMEQAREAIESNRALRKLEQLIAESNRT